MIRVVIEVDDVNGYYQWRAMMVDRENGKNKYLPFAQYMATNKEAVVKRGVKALKKIIMGTE